MMRGDGGNKARSPGRSRISRKTIAQGRPVVRLVPVVLPRAFLLHADHGCERHPAFPAPSSSNEGELIEKLGRHAPRECTFTSLSVVMPCFKRGIQQAAASQFKHGRLCVGESGEGSKPGDDSEILGGMAV